MRSRFNSLNLLPYHSGCGCGWSLNTSVLPVAPFAPDTLHSMTYTWNTVRKRKVIGDPQKFVEVKQLYAYDIILYMYKVTFLWVPGRRSQTYW